MNRNLEESNRNNLRKIQQINALNKQEIYINDNTYEPTIPQNDNRIQNPNDHIPILRNQSDWLNKNNILRIRNAISSNKINTIEQLKHYIGYESKKRDDNGNYTPGSRILEYKLNNNTKMKANKCEYEFYLNNTHILSKLGLKAERHKSGNIYLFFDEDNISTIEREKINELNNSGFSILVYNFFMGKLLYENVKRNFVDISDIDIINSLNNMYKIRSLENYLFKSFGNEHIMTSSEKQNYNTHLHATTREDNSIKQIETYLKYKDRLIELLEIAKYYKKYLKYKQKYFALLEI